MKSVCPSPSASANTAPFLFMPPVWGDGLSKPPAMVPVFRFHSIYSPLMRSTQPSRFRSTGVVPLGQGPDADDAVKTPLPLLSNRRRPGGSEGSFDASRLLQMRSRSPSLSKSAAPKVVSSLIPVLSNVV